MNKRKTFSAAAAATVAFMSLAGAGVAVAADPVIDAGKDGASSIVITKYERTDTNGVTHGDGKQQAITDPVVANVTFTLKEVKSIGGTDITGFDLKTNEGWAKLAGLMDQNGQPKGAIEYVDAGSTQVTSEAGLATFSNLAFGLYEVSETDTPAGVTPAAPFYVTLPFASDNDYLYDVHAYPKNSMDKAVKTVDDTKAHGVGSEIAYTIETSVSPYDGRTKYVVEDQLDSRLTYKSIAVSLPDGTSLVENTDFTVTTEGGKVVMTVTALDKLNAQQGVGKNLKTVITTTLDANTIGDLVNKATFTPNQDPKYTDNPIETPAVTTELGKVQLTKVSSSDETVKLEGAEFELYDADGNKVTFYDGEGNKVDKVTTNKDGVAVFSGLRVSDFENGGAVTGDQVDTYMIKEVKAPKGYGLLPEMIPVTLTTQAGADGSTVTLDVKNAPENIGFKLAKTGATGTIVLLALGSTVLVGAGGAMTLAKRKSGAEA